MIERYEIGPAVCLPYDEHSAVVAREVAALIVGRLPFVEVEHIGSSSVLGCDGKGVIDLQLVYPRGRLEVVKAALDTLGFQRQRTRNPFPEDRPMRTGAYRHRKRRYLVHVHVLDSTSSEVDRDRLFRDRLRVDGALRDRYVALKREIIESGVSDSVDYADAKGTFILAALREMADETR